MSGFYEESLYTKQENMCGSKGSNNDRLASNEPQYEGENLLAVGNNLHI